MGNEGMTGWGLGAWMGWLEDMVEGGFGWGMVGTQTGKEGWGQGGMGQWQFMGIGVGMVGETGWLGSGQEGNTMSPVNRHTHL